MAALKKRVRHKSRLLKVWTKDSSESLGGCFLPAEGSIFHETDVDSAAETVTDCIKLRVDNVVKNTNTKKAITVFPNNKSSITKEVK